MRQGCELKGANDEPCGEPAVDFIMTNFGERKLWLCATHFDRWMHLARILGWARNDWEKSE
jgi:hypothetical protein